MKRAFTLIESLLVLMIVLVFIFIPTISMQQMSEQIEVVAFFDQLEKQLLRAQQTAITDQVSVEVFVENNQREIHCSINNMPTLAVPETVTVIHFPKIVFREKTGNYTRMRKIEFYWLTKKQPIVYQFLFGSGRYVQTQ